MLSKLVLLAGLQLSLNGCVWSSVGWSSKARRGRATHLSNLGVDSSLAVQDPTPFSAATLDTLYIWMEYMDMGSLVEFLNSYGPLKDNVLRCGVSWAWQFLCGGVWGGVQISLSSQQSWYSLGVHTQHTTAGG